jgi:hypothetical protein
VLTIIRQCREPRAIGQVCRFSVFAQKKRSNQGFRAGGFAPVQIMQSRADLTAQTWQSLPSAETFPSARPRALNSATPSHFTPAHRIVTRSICEGAIQARRASEGGRIKTRRASEGGRIKTRRASEGGRIKTRRASEGGRIKARCASEGAIQTRRASEGYGSSLARVGLFHGFVPRKGLADGITL